MPKLKNLFAALVLSLASFLPFVGTDVSAVSGDHITARITINNGLDYTEPGVIYFDDLTPISSGETTEYESTGGTHTISFAMSFERELMGYTFTAATVNGVDATLIAPTHTGEDNDYRVIVNEDTNYVINLTAERTGEERYTIIWANPDVKTEIHDKDMLIKNGFAKVVAVYDPGNHLVDPVEYNVNPDSDGGLVDGYGHVKIAAGFKVVFEFTPVYGYQLVGVKANDLPLAPQEATNQYTFTMPNTNIHFAADFAKTSDMVITGSEKVSSGIITLSKNTLGAGTAQLAVNDVDLDSDKIADFGKAANGMAISNILDIDFYNVFFKGKDDSSDVWSNQIHELSEEATITLKLADDVDVSRVAIVHNIDDGDKYEIIKIDSYDTEAHTITFKAKSFSNFAIAIGAGSPNSGFATSAGASATSAIVITTSIVAILMAAAWLIRKRTA